MIEITKDEYGPVEMDYMSYYLCHTDNTILNDCIRRAKHLAISKDTACDQHCQEYHRKFYLLMCQLRDYRKAHNRLLKELDRLGSYYAEKRVVKDVGSLIENIKCILDKSKPSTL